MAPLVAGLGLRGTLTRLLKSAHFLRRCWSSAELQRISRYVGPSRHFSPLQRRVAFCGRCLTLVERSALHLFAFF